MTLYGGIEGGGTKFVCALGNENGELLETARFPTTTPGETIGRAIEFFAPHAEELTAVGIGSFGPVDLNPDSPMYGHILATPKPGWSYADVAGPLRAALGVPIGFELDVNVAAIGEHRWGAAQGLDTFIYLTIGTGIGGGVMAEGNLLHGAMHPEMGHVFLAHDRAADPFEGACPFHGDCFEGLAAGPAIEQRWGQKGASLAADHPAWELEAHYVALGLVSFICTLSPQRIIIGGGVMQQPSLFPLVREKVVALLNGYLKFSELENMEIYIVPPALGGEAGVKGALALAYLTNPTGNLKELPYLTRRQREMVVLIAQGLANKEIAAKLSKRDQTVKNMVSRLYKILGAFTRQELELEAQKFLTRVQQGYKPGKRARKTR